jgi:hypothetical protein
LRRQSQEAGTEADPFPRCSVQRACLGSKQSFDFRCSIADGGLEFRGKDAVRASPRGFSSIRPRIFESPWLWAPQGWGDLRGGHITVAQDSAIQVDPLPSLRAVAIKPPDIPAPLANLDVGVRECGDFIVNIEHRRQPARQAPEPVIPQ